MNSFNGEFLTKTARYNLTQICLEGVEKELKELEDMGIAQKSRGRPPTPEAILASKLGVTQKTVKRWTDPSSIHSNDENAGKIVELAFNYDPDNTADILRRDILIYQTIVESWLTEAEVNILSYYPEIRVKRVIKVSP